MKKTILGILGFYLVVGFVSCVRRAEKPVYYTRVGFYFENGRHLTTNYQRGTRVFINTPIRYLDMDNTFIKIQLIDTEERILIQNVSKFSRRSVREIFDLMFSPTPVDLKRIDPDTLSAIKNGRVLEGMTRDEVIMALGYPPGHKTPSLDEDTWIYWQNKVDTIDIHFDNGVVDWIRD